MSKKRKQQPGAPKGAPDKTYTYQGMSYSVPADVAGPELERIWAKNGERLVPADIVAEARPATAVLHPVFEWNDAAAAEKYRLDQARTLTRSVRVTIENAEPRHLFVHVEMEKRPHHYQHTSVIFSKPGEYEAALAELLRKLNELQAAVTELRNLGKKARPNDLSKMDAIIQALMTARSLTEHLQ